MHENQGSIEKDDNLYIRPSICESVKERAAREALRVTWINGHATQEQVAHGVLTQEENYRNKKADELATSSINLNQCDRVMLKVARRQTAAGGH